MRQNLSLGHVNREYIFLVDLIQRDGPFQIFNDKIHGFLTLAGGIIITFAKEILTLITG